MFKTSHFLTMSSFGGVKTKHKKIFRPIRKTNDKKPLLTKTFPSMSTFLSSELLESCLFCLSDENSKSSFRKGSNDQTLASEEITSLGSSPLLRQCSRDFEIDSPSHF